MKVREKSVLPETDAKNSGKTLESLSEFFPGISLESTAGTPQAL